MPSSNGASRLGHELSRFQLDRVYREIISLADRQKSVSDDEVTAIIERMLADATATSARSA